MTEDLPLFAPAVPPLVANIHGQMEDSHAAFLARLRRLLADNYANTGMAVSTDEAWGLMRGQGIELPEGASPNLMGSLFSAWDRAKAVGWTRSKRDGANGNLLRTWSIS